MCKKLTFMLMVLAVVGLAVPASATYWLRGDWNGWGDDVNFPQNPMTEAGGVYSGTVTGLTVDSLQEFKFYDDIMEEYHAGDNSAGAANCWFYADGAGDATVTYNTNVVSDDMLPAQNRVGVSVDPGNWVIAGSFSGAGYPDWDTTALVMDALGGGIYELELSLPMGGGPDWADPGLNTYAWKAVCAVTGYGGWVSLAESGRNLNTGNSLVTVEEGLEGARFTLDAYTGVVKTELIPEPATIALLGLGGLALIRRKR